MDPINIYFLLSIEPDKIEELIKLHYTNKIEKLESNLQKNIYKYLLIFCYKHKSEIELRTMNLEQFRSFILPEIFETLKKQKIERSPKYDLKIGKISSIFYQGYINYIKQKSFENILTLIRKNIKTEFEKKILPIYIPKYPTLKNDLQEKKYLCFY